MTFSVLDAAREHPDRIALVVDHEPYTYEALAARTRAAMAWLWDRGIRGHEDARVAFVGTNRIETVVWLYALMELGAPAVVLHPRLTAAERASVIEDARPALVIDEAATPGTSDAPNTPSASSPAPVAPIAPIVQGHDTRRTLAILYTSGTSGRSKGVMLSRGAFAAAARGSEHNLGWQPDDRWLLCMPLAHVGGLSIVVRALLARRCVVFHAMAGAPGSHFEPDGVAHTIASDRVTLVSFVPTMLKKMLDHGWQPPPHLRAILLGGAAASPRLLDEARSRELPVLTTYGLTEACSQVTVQRLGTVPSAANGAGEPLAGTEVRIVDDEIHVRGPSLMTGYFPLAARPSPIAADGWFRTGDMGRIDAQGRLHVLARRDDRIITGGENVYPIEVETVLERIPGVRDVCVFGVADEMWGAIVAAALVPETADTTPDDAVLLAHIESNLASHRRPRRVAWLPELARGAQQKLDRARTAAMAGPLLRPLRKG